MNQLIKGLFAILIVSPTLILGQSRIVQDSFYSEGLDATIQLNIYLPVAVEELTDLPLYIFLHDCCGLDHNSFQDTMVPALDQGISTGLMQPLIVIWPSIQNGPFNNLHQYVDSPASGPFESVITQELLSWIAKQSAYPISDLPCRRAIGGFGMGADGAIRIVTKNPELFVSAISHHGGGGLAIRGYADLLPGVLFESPQAAPAYTFHPSNGGTTAQFFGASVAFSPNMEKPPHYADFIVTADGKIDSTIMEGQWVPNHNPATILEQHMQNASFEGPALYFDHGSEGSAVQFVMRPFAQRFASELDSIGYSYTYHELSNGYTLTQESFTSGLTWVNELFCSATTSITSKPISPIKLRIYPNPSAGQVDLSIPWTNVKELYLELRSALGHVVLSETLTLNGEAYFRKDFSGVPVGTYFMKITNPSAGSAVARIALVR